jgi:hypothetical protein
LLPASYGSPSKLNNRKRHGPWYHASRQATIEQSVEHKKLCKTGAQGESFGRAAGGFIVYQ